MSWLMGSWNDPGVPPEQWGVLGYGHSGNDDTLLLLLNSMTTALADAANLVLEPRLLSGPLLALCVFSSLIILATPCKRCASRGTEKLSNQPEATQLVRG